MLLAFYLPIALAFTEIKIWVTHNDSVGRVDRHERLLILQNHAWAWTIMSGTLVVWSAWQIGYVPDIGPTPLPLVLFMVANAAIAIPLTVRRLSKM